MHFFGLGTSANKVRYYLLKVLFIAQAQEAKLMLAISHLSAVSTICLEWVYNVIVGVVNIWIGVALKMI